MLLYFFQKAINIKPPKKCRNIYIQPPKGIYFPSFTPSSFFTIFLQFKPRNSLRIMLPLTVNYNSYFGTMKILQNSPKIVEIESRLAKYTYLSRNNLPGYLDGIVFQAINSSHTYPDRNINPNLYHWYILMRQFAPSTIERWIEDRLYYDANDALIKSRRLFHTNSMTTTGSGSPSKEENPGELKSPKLDSGQMEYVIDVLLKEINEPVMAQLRKCLEDYKVDIITDMNTTEVTIKCGVESGKRQEIANLITKNVEYQNLQVKRLKKLKYYSFREEPTRQ